ncbi:MAG: hypothetical protein AAF533_02230 [Acidobacteriota bacterium]
MSEGETVALSCRHCAKPLHLEATRCPHCQRSLLLEEGNPWGFIVGLFMVCLVMTAFLTAFALSASQPARASLATGVVNPSGVTLLEQRVGTTDHWYFGRSYGSHLVGFGRWCNDGEVTARGLVKLTCTTDDHQAFELAQGWLGSLEPGEEDVFRLSFLVEERSEACDVLRLELVEGRVR